MSLQIALNYLKESGTDKTSETMALLLNVGLGKAGEAALQVVMDNADHQISGVAKACMLLAMSPFVTFGVGPETVPQPKDIPPTRNLRGPWGQGTVELLINLAGRSLTGHSARDAIYHEMTLLEPHSQDLLYRVLVKEMRIGAGPKTVNKFHKGLIPIFEHKGAKRTKEALHKVEWPAWAEYKLDGFRCVVKTNGSILSDPDTFSRNGLPMDNLVPRAVELHALTGYLIAEGVLEDRAWAWDGEGKKMGEHFNSTSSEARKAGKGADLTYNIFDLVPWEHMSGGTEPIEVRHARLDKVQEFLNRAAPWPQFPMLRTVERFELDCVADAWELYDMARELGHEGLIIKQKGSFYTPGKTVEWVKVKPEETEDLTCTGTYMGEKGSKLESVLGGIIVDFKGVPVRVGNLTKKQRQEWLDDPTLVVGKVVEILYHETTPDGSLREPRISKKGVRHDKYPEDADGQQGAV